MKLMTLREVADHFNVSLNTAKTLPIAFTRVGKGRQRRYHPSLVKRYEVLNASSAKGALELKEAS